MRKFFAVFSVLVPITYLWCIYRWIPSEFLSGLHTVFSVLSAGLMALALYLIYDQITISSMKRKYVKLLRAEYKRTQELLNGPETVFSFALGKISLIITNLNPYILQEAITSGAFKQPEVAELIELTRLYAIYNLYVQTFFTMVTTDEYANTLIAARNLKDTQHSLLQQFKDSSFFN